MEWTSSTATEKVQRVARDIADRVDAVINQPSEGPSIVDLREDSIPEVSPQPAT